MIQYIGIFPIPYIAIHPFEISLAAQIWRFEAKEVSSFLFNVMERDGTSMVMLEAPNAI